jgi:multiple sugar transport system substrate-binding protein
MTKKSLSRRAFLRGAGVTMAGLAVAACAPAAPAPAAEAPAAPAASTEAPAAAAPAAAAAKIAFWTEGWPEWITPQIDAYKKVKPETTIDFVTFKWGEMMPKLLTATAGGTSPNLIIQDRFRMAGWAARGGCTALDDYVAQYKINKDDYIPATWAECIWQGKVNAIPWQTDGRFIFWNKDLFAAAGLDPEKVPPTEDWAAMVDLAKKLTKTASDGSVDVMGYVPAQVLNYGNGGDFVYAWANGGEFMKDEKTAWMDNPKLIETLTWQNDVITAVGGMDKASAFASGWPTTAGFSAFGSGKLAMAVDGDWNLANWKKYYPDLKFGMAPWNMRNDASKSTGFAGGFCMAVPTGAKELPATFEWLNYLTSYDNQVDVGVKLQCIPALTKAAMSDALINSSPYPDLRKMANQSMQYANFRPITPAGDTIQELWAGPGTGRDWVLYGKKTVDQAIKDMQTQVQQALDDFWASAA